MTEQRYKKRADYSPAEHLRDLQGRPGDRPRIETPEYVAKKTEALREAGCTDEAAEVEAVSPREPTTIEDMTRVDHYRQLGGCREAGDEGGDRGGPLDDPH